MTTFNDIEKDIRSSNTLEELKECMIKMCEESNGIEYSIEQTDKDLELTRERVSNIEDCLDENKRIINTDRLRL